jgi:hypothetical protein
MVAPLPHVSQVSQVLLDHAKVGDVVWGALVAG